MRSIGSYQADVLERSCADFVAHAPVAFLVLAARDDGLRPATAESAPTVEKPSARTPRRSAAPARDGAYLVFPLAQPELLIGRHGECDVAINDQSISRHHARFIARAGRFYVVDVESTLGTRVNADLAEPHVERELFATDKLTLGDVALFFLPAREFYAFVKNHFA